MVRADTNVGTEMLWLCARRSRTDRVPQELAYMPRAYMRYVSPLFFAVCAKPSVPALPAARQIDDMMASTQAVRCCRRCPVALCDAIAWPPVEGSRMTAI